MSHSTPDNSIKELPKSTPQVAEMLNLGGNFSTASEPVVENHSPANLPVVETTAHEAHSHSAEHVSAHQEASSHDSVADQVSEVDVTPNRTSNIVKSALPYLAIFLVGIFLYYFYFSTFSFSSVTDLFKKVKVADQVTNVASDISSKVSAYETLKQANLDSYYAYINQFYFDTSDASVTDPDADNSKNGLTNFQKFLLGLNPKVYDTLGIGQADSVTLAEGLDPLTGQPLNDNRKQLVDNFIDLEAASNRLAQASINSSAQQTTNSNSETNSSTTYATANYGARNGGATSAARTNSAIANNNSVTSKPSVAGANTTKTAPATGPKQTSTNNSYSNVNSLPGASPVSINDSVNATLEIPSLKINVPIIFTKDTKDFEKDLENGVVHYPGTALPGGIGTAYISGHSSNYAWKAGNYKRIFATINKLKKGDSFTITATLQDGSQVKLHYVVMDQKQYKADDQAQFANTDKSVVALSTCWPLNTTAKRLVVRAQLTQVEK